MKTGINVFKNGEYIPTELLLLQGVPSNRLWNKTLGYAVTARSRLPAALLSIAERQPLFGVCNEAVYITAPFLAVCLRLPATPVVGKAISAPLIP
jgi:hypothetical protein